MRRVDKGEQSLLGVTQLPKYGREQGPGFVCLGVNANDLFNERLRLLILFLDETLRCSTEAGTNISGWFSCLPGASEYTACLSATFASPTPALLDSGGILFLAALAPLLLSEPADGILEFGDVAL